jgi:hypothetical protein
MPSDLPRHGEAGFRVAWPCPQAGPWLLSLLYETRKNGCHGPVGQVRQLAWPLVGSEPTSSWTAPARRLPPLPAFPATGSLDIPVSVLSSMTARTGQASRLPGPPVPASGASPGTESWARTGPAAAALLAAALGLFHGCRRRFARLRVWPVVLLNPHVREPARDEFATRHVWQCQVTAL